MIRIGADEPFIEEYLAPFTSIGEDWAILAAGDGTARDAWNGMTVSWGLFGVIWGMRSVTVAVRPSRHTYGFVERQPLLSLSFFSRECRKALDVFGSKSGRDTDKAAMAGLTPVLLEDGLVGFAEAELTLACRRLYAHDLDPAAVSDPAIARNYPSGDYHRLHVCELTGAYVP